MSKLKDYPIGKGEFTLISKVGNMPRASTTMFI